jgi:hypothetical protein
MDDKHASIEPILQWLRHGQTPTANGEGKHGDRVVLNVRIILRSGAADRETMTRRELAGSNGIAPEQCRPWIMINGLTAESPIQVNPVVSHGPFR